MPTIRRLLQSASFRLAAIYVGLFVASVGALGVVVYVMTGAAIEGELRQRIEVETRYLLGVRASIGTERLLQAVEARGRAISALDYGVSDASGRVLAGILPAGLGVPGWNRVSVREADERGREPELLYVVRLPDGGTLAVGDDLGRVFAAGRAIGRVFAFAIVGLLMLGIGGGVLISRAFLHRIDAIAGTAEAIIDGDLRRRVPVRGTEDDLDRLAVTLNRMLDRIAALLGSLRQLGSNVAHDLRTPLGQLRQTLEEARRDAVTARDFRAAIDQAIAKAHAMHQIFAALLRIAQLEGGSGASAFATLDLADVLETVADAYEPLAEQDGYTLAVTVQPECGAISGDRELLSQLLANLVENALQHTPPGTNLRLGARRRADQRVELVVEDDGPGVPEADLPRIAERFFRCERSRTSPGHGLGLSLVAAIAELHDAEFSIENTNPGLRLRLAFPPARDAPPAREASLARDAPPARDAALVEPSLRRP